MTFSVTGISSCLRMQVQSQVSARARADRTRDRFRVLILNDSARIGGAERSLMYLAKHLDPERFEVTVVCAGNGPLIEMLEKTGIRVNPMNLSHFSRSTRFSYVRYLTSLFRLYQLIRKLRVDILHCNSCRAAHWGIPLNWLLSIRTICHVRDSHYTRATKFLLKHARRDVEVVAVSAAIKKILQSAGVPETQISVIYNGEDAEFYRPELSRDALAREFPLVANRFKIGIIARIVEWKRHIDLIEAVGMLRDKLDVQLFIVGEVWTERSDLINVLKNRIRTLQLDERVTFTGFREDVRNVLAGLDIVVTPSEEEPFGRVILEAMAIGKPVIGTLSGGIPEIIRSGIDGLLVPVRDPAAIACAIETLATDRELSATLAENARRRVAMLFSVENNIRDIHALYLGRE